MKHPHYRVPAICLLFILLLATAASAYLQPSVNLGFTSFLDGAPPAGPGFYFQEYISYYEADETPQLSVAGAEIEAWVSLNQFIYQSNTPLLLGGKWGMNVIVPVVLLDADPEPPLSTNDGLGDIVVGPFLQWDPIMGKNGPIFMHRVELQMLLPTGKYDEDDPLNPGSNFFSFDPYWAGTYFFTPRLTASWRLHYLWNTKNEDPWIGLDPGGVRDSQAGEAFHANFAASYEVLPKRLRVGVNGYYFDQTDSSEVNGHDVNADEKVFAIGPGGLLSFSQNTHLFFNAYFESDAENRPEGERFVLRLVHHF